MNRACKLVKLVTRYLDLRTEQVRTNEDENGKA